jgi:hypothetical protein
MCQDVALRRESYLLKPALEPCWQLLQPFSPHVEVFNSYFL